MRNEMNQSPEIGLKQVGEMNVFFYPPPPGGEGTQTSSIASSSERGVLLETVFL